MLPVRILDVAAEEVARAADHIEIERPGYGARFLEAYADQLDLIATFPSLGALVLDAPEGGAVRRRVGIGSRQPDSARSSTKRNA